MRRMEPDQEAPTPTEPGPAETAGQRAAPGQAAEAGGPEEVLLEPTIPHAGTLPPHLLTRRPFLWLVLGEGLGGLAFWSYLAAMWADAPFRFGATPRQMALLGASLSLPYVLALPLQGVLVDRWSPKWLNLCGHLALVAAVPAAWAATSVASLYASSFLVGLAFAAIEPARSALTGLLVEEGRLVQANGMLSASSQLSLVVGTLGTGSVLLVAGSGSVYAGAVGAGALALGFNVAVPDIRQGGRRPALALGDLAEGARTCWRLPELRLLLAVAGAGWTLLNVFFVLEPLFVRGVLGQGESAISFLWAASGAGSLVGAVAISRARRGTGRELAMVGAGVAAAGLGTLVYAGPGLFRVALAGAVVMGAGFSFMFPPSLALIQRVVGEEQRGRVTSVFGALQEAMALASSLAIGALGGLVAVRPTMLGVGVALAATGLLGLWAVGRGAPAGGAQ